MYILTTPCKLDVRQLSATKAFAIPKVWIADRKLSVGCRIFQMSKDLFTVFRANQDPLSKLAFMHTECGRGGGLWWVVAQS